MRNRSSLFIIFMLVFSLIIGCSNEGPAGSAVPAVVPEGEKKETFSQDNEKNTLNNSESTKFDFPYAYLNQILEPRPVHFRNEEDIGVKVVGNSRYGSMELISIGKALMQSDDNSNRYSGQFEVRFVDQNGESAQIVLLDKLTIEEDVSEWEWGIREFDGYDLFVFQANQTNFYTHEYPLRNIRLFVVTDSGEAFPLSFLMHNEGGNVEFEEVTIHGDYPLAGTNDEIAMYSFLPELEKLIFDIDIRERNAVLTKVENANEHHENARALAQAQARDLEVILFFEAGDSQNVIDTDQDGWEALLKRVSKQASQQESYQYLQQNRKKHDRAFLWGISDVYWNEQTGELSYTFSANLAYAVGQDARLEVHMIKQGAEWIFSDFGSLYIEQFGSSSPKVIIEHE